MKAYLIGYKAKHEASHNGGDVFFRFNPQKFEKEIELSRTVKALTQAVKGKLEKKNVVDGGR